MQIVEQPAPCSNCPTDFPVGYHVIVALSHPTHADKEGTVYRHTKKYVMFTSKEHSSDIIRILPKSLAAYHPNRQCKINSSDNNNEYNLGQAEHEHEMYDQLDKTQTFQVADGFISFTRTF
jgi:hypothetical protein